MPDRAYWWLEIYGMNGQFSEKVVELDDEEYALLVKELHTLEDSKELDDWRLDPYRPEAWSTGFLETLGHVRDVLG